MATATNTKSRPQPQQQSQRGNNGQANRPFYVVRRGLLKVVVWENQTTNGTMFSTQLIRVYKDGEEWKESHSLNREDLLHAAKMLDQVDTIIHREEEKRREQQQQQSD